MPLIYVLLMFYVGPYASGVSVLDTDLTMEDCEYTRIVARAVLDPAIAEKTTIVCMTTDDPVLVVMHDG